jgi:hypothetical protein
MLSKVSSAIAWLLAADYAVLGLCLFLAPDRSSAAFAWKISPLVAMTVGAWCLGNAFAAGVVAKRRQWKLVATTILYLAAFGIAQAAVVWNFRALLQLDGRPLSWLYLAALGISGLLTIAAAIDLARSPARRVAAAQIGGFSILLTLVFIGIVGYLGYYGLTVPPGGRGLHATIFPEVLSMFSVRSFGAFYLSLALAATPLPLIRRRAMFQTHAFALYGLLILITAAAANFPDAWHFSSEPHQLLYPGLYLLVGVVVGFYLLRYGTGSVQEPPS